MSQPLALPARRPVLALALAWLALALSAPAADYYVELTGTDSVTVAGTSLTNAWRTIGYALLNSEAHATINIGPGTFPEWVVISNPVTLSGSDLYLPDSPPLQRHQSLTILTPPTNLYPESPFINVQTGNVNLLNLTINGDGDGDGTADAKIGVYSLHRPLTVSNCVLANLNGFGMMIGTTNNAPFITPTPATTDTDDLRCYFGFNLITNITRSVNIAAGLFMQYAPATCEFNEFAHINGTNAYAALYIRQCFYTTNMTQPLIVRDSYFEDCKQAIWANDYGAPGEPILMYNNTIADSQVGIRVTAAGGQATLSNNAIQVAGVTLSATPIAARGIWIHADANPWSSASATDHQVAGNSIQSDGATTGSVGLFLGYDTVTGTGINNGVRATVLGNSIAGFDTGLRLESGTSQVGVPADPLVEAVIHENDVFDYGSAAFFVIGLTQTVNATNNYWGLYTDPSGVVSSNVLTSGWTLGRILYDTDGDGTKDYLDDDDDGDFILDLDEVLLGTLPNNADTDGDGLTDYEEIHLTGTSPTNVLSLLRVSGFEAIDTHTFRLSWPSVTNIRYNVDRATDLLADNWLRLTNLAATPPTNDYTDSPPLPAGPFYYRISVTN